MGSEEEEEQASKRPKIVDKRISAGGHVPTPRPEPAQSGTVPAPEQAQSGSAPGHLDPSHGGRGAASATPAPPGGEQVWTPEQEEQARRMVEEIARTPSIEWVLNAAVNLANVAGTKIEMGAVEDAQLAIDAFAALVNGLPGKLQDAEVPLKQTLAQLQLLYAERIRGAPPGPEPGK